MGNDESMPEINYDILLSSLLCYLDLHSSTGIQVLYRSMK